MNTVTLWGLIGLGAYSVGFVLSLISLGLVIRNKWIFPAIAAGVVGQILFWPIILIDLAGKFSSLPAPQAIPFTGISHNCGVFDDNLLCDKCPGQASTLMDSNMLSRKTRALSQPFRGAGNNPPHTPLSRTIASSAQKEIISSTSPVAHAFAQSRLACIRIARSTSDEPKISRTD